jgi:predicted SnoaL-like aldol condensation-catalyzing enzyme
VVRVLILICACLPTGQALAQLPVEAHTDPAALLASPDPALAANKRLAFDFWREVVVAHHVERAPEFLAENFKQHDPTVASGRAAFVKLASASPAVPVKPTLDDLVAIVAENDLVVLSFRRELPDLRNEGQTYTTTWFEMLRVENGKIAEHWDYGTKE